MQGGAKADRLSFPWQDTGRLFALEAERGLDRSCLKSPGEATLVVVSFQAQLPDLPGNTCRLYYATELWENVWPLESKLRAKDVPRHPTGKLAHVVRFGRGESKDDKLYLRNLKPQAISLISLGVSRVLCSPQHSGTTAGTVATSLISCLF